MVDGWTWTGERALVKRFERADLAAATAFAAALADEIRGLRLPEVEDVVPGARTLHVSLRPGARPSEALLAAGRNPGPRNPTRLATSDVHVVPVEYGGQAGPDLSQVARQHGLPEAEVVRLHTEPTYVVGFIGFSPGFPYLLGLPALLATPRLATPRTRVPAGSVGIGGPYTGIYPRQTPGGWVLVGRTDVELFDPVREPPAVLTPGSLVRFEEHGRRNR